MKHRFGSRPSLNERSAYSWAQTNNKANVLNDWGTFRIGAQMIDVIRHLFYDKLSAIHCRLPDHETFFIPVVFCNLALYNDWKFVDEEVDHSPTLFGGRPPLLNPLAFVDAARLG